MTTMELGYRAVIITVIHSAARVRVYMFVRAPGGTELLPDSRRTEWEMKTSVVHVYHVIINNYNSHGGEV